MQGTSPAQHGVMDAESSLGGLLPSGSVYAFLAEHRRELFPDAMFADLFPSHLGRPSVPADVVAAVLVLQALEGRSDREAIEALTFDLRWKAACGLPVAAAGFHPTVLTYWRRRLARSTRPNRIFDAVRAVVAATGAFSGKSRRALDATILEDAVATQDTVTQLIAAIRRVRRDVPGAAEVVAAHCRAHDYDDPGKPVIAWTDPEARAALVDALVTAAHRLLGHLPEQPLGPRPAEAVALLALVAGQDVEPAEDSDGTDGRWRIARRVAPDRVISPVSGSTTRWAVNPSVRRCTVLCACRASGSTVEMTRSAVTRRAICHRPSVPSLSSAGSTSWPATSASKASASAARGSSSCSGRWPSSRCASPTSASTSPARASASSQAIAGFPGSS